MREKGSRLAPFFGCKSRPGTVRLRLLSLHARQEWRHFRRRYRLSMFEAVKATVRSCWQFLKAPANDCWWCGGTGHRLKAAGGKAKQEAPTE